MATDLSATGEAKMETSTPGVEEEHQDKSSRCKRCRPNEVLYQISSLMHHYMEVAFFKLGKVCASYPFYVSMPLLSLCLALSTGLFYFTQEGAPERLWIPQSSPIYREYEWITSGNNPTSVLSEAYLIEGSDVLTPTGVQLLLEAYQRILNIRSFGRSTRDVCTSSPDSWLNMKGAEILEGLSDEDLKKLSLRDFLSMTSFIDVFAPKARRYLKIFPRGQNLTKTQVWCILVDLLPHRCVGLSLLDIWGYNVTHIRSLTKKDIIHDVNRAATRIPPDNYLGGIVRNKSGAIVSARVLLNTISIANKELPGDTEVVSLSGLSSSRYLHIMDWESKFIKTILSIKKKGFKLYPSAQRSYEDQAGKRILDDALKLLIGYSLIFIHMNLVLGNFSWVRHKVLLSIVGLIIVIISITSSYGICLYFKVIYCPINSVLPFLLLAIGIDNMFVIVQCYKVSFDYEEDQSHVEQVGRAMQRAGVSITITSLTNFSALIVGASSRLPGLKNFCIYAGIGILFLYVLQITFFVCMFSLDIKRIQANRDGILFCVKHDKRAAKNRLLSEEITNKAFRYYSDLLCHRVSQVLVILFTLSLLGLQLYGLSQLETKFDALWFIPSDSYLMKFVKAMKSNFASDSVMCQVNFGALDYAENMVKLKTFVTKLRGNRKFIDKVHSWVEDFEAFLMGKYHIDFTSPWLNSENFSTLLSEFLFSPLGQIHQHFIRLKGPLNCSEPAPQILASSVRYSHKEVPHKLQLEAAHMVNNLIRKMKFGKGHAGSYCVLYVSWLSTEIIGEELLFNMTYAVIVIFLLTLILIANITACLLVTLSVALTLVGVAGLMYYWGLTIDTVSCIQLVLAVGLSVDYSAHIAHMFMNQTGTRIERTKGSLNTIGPAVLHGGISTFLAFLPLSSSNSHVFLSFYKIFLGVVLFGLYHGLVFLPAALCLFGPLPYKKITELSI